MSMPVNYYHAEMLSNLISQTRYVLQNLKKKGHIFPQVTALEYQTIHFGGMRGSGHSYAIEDLSFVYKTTIISPQKQMSHSNYPKVKPGTVKTWMSAAMQPGLKVKDAFEIVVIDNWINMVLPEYPDLSRMIDHLSYAYDVFKNDTIFVLVH